MLSRMQNVLVTGSNRGIGLGLVKEFLKVDGLQHLFATCRDPVNADVGFSHYFEEILLLKEMKNDNRLHVLEMDVDCDKSVETCYIQVEKIVGNDGLQMLVNNAGIKELVKDFRQQLTRSPNAWRQIWALSYRRRGLSSRMGTDKDGRRVEESATDLIKSFEEMKSEESGGYFDRHGKTMPY